MTAEKPCNSQGCSFPPKGIAKSQGYHINLKYDPHIDVNMEQIGGGYIHRYTKVLHGKLVLKLLCIQHETGP